jgi:hypothetical protein
MASSPKPNPTHPPLIASGPRLTSPAPRSNGTVLADKTFPMLAKFNCTLPAELAWNGRDERALPGFLDMATGHFVSDPAARMINVAELGADALRTVASPVLNGLFGISYTWSGRRWLPASWDQVAPDGLRYAYPELVGPSSDRSSPITNAEVSIHVVDVPAATDRVISTGPGWGILDYGTDGIYVTKTRYYSGESNNGLWRMDPTTGSTRQLLPESARTLSLRGAAVWGLDVPMRATTLYRYDLDSGTREVWYARPDTVVVLRGIDAKGRPLVGVSKGDQAAELWLLTGPNRGTLLHSKLDGPFGAGPSDSHGTWMSGESGLWLLRPDSQLIHVTTARVEILGDCR